MKLREGTPGYEEVAQLVIMLAEAGDGDRAAQKAIKEAFTTADFPGLFQKAVNAQAEARYTVVPPIWQTWAKRYQMKGLRKEDFVDLAANFDNLPKTWSGARTLPGGLPRIAEGTEYPAIGFTGSETEVWTYKLGARLAFTWEAFEADDWGMIAQLPDAMVAVARRTEDLAATAALWDINGLRTDVWVPANILAGNPLLSYASLSAAIQQAGASPGAGSQRVNTISKWALIVPRSLEMTARNILSTVQIRQTDADGTVRVVNNTIGTGVEIVVNPFIASIASGSAYKDLNWVLVPYAGNGSDRTSIVETFKRGDDTPSLRIKNDQGNALGGGAINPMDGSFDADDIQIRVRHFCNSMVTDSSIGFVASKGTVAA